VQALASDEFADRPQDLHITGAIATFESIKVEFLVGIGLPLVGVKHDLEIAPFVAKGTLNTIDGQVLSKEARPFTKLPPAVHIAILAPDYREWTAARIERFASSFCG